MRRKSFIIWHAFDFQEWPQLDVSYSLKLHLTRNGKPITNVPVAVWRSVLLFSHILQICRILNLSNLILTDLHFTFSDLLILTRKMLLALLVELRRFRMEFFGKILLQDSKKLQVIKILHLLDLELCRSAIHRCTRGGGMRGTSCTP